MDQFEQEPKKRGRPPKSDRDVQIKAERRRRNSDALAGKRRRLAVDESKLDRENFVYRWVNDDGSRVELLSTQDDWDVVSDRDGAMKEGIHSAKVETTVGVGERGSPVKAVLMRKPKNYHDDDEAAKQRRIDESERAIREGQSQGATAENSYVPDSGIQIGR